MIDASTLHQRIEATGRKLEELLAEIEDAGKEAAEAEAAFGTAFAKARLKVRYDNAAHKMTVDEAEDRATVASEVERKRHLIAKNRLLVAREALRARQSQMDALRSLLATFRAAGG